MVINLIQKLIDNYVYNMKECDVKSFALKNGIVLSDDETSYIFSVIKKEGNGINHVLPILDIISNFT